MRWIYFDAKFFCWIKFLFDLKNVFCFVKEVQYKEVQYKGSAILPFVKEVQYTRAVELASLSERLASLGIMGAS